jgi:N-methylhydantoinase A
VTTSNMYAQFTPLMARRGVDPRDFTLLAYGGAGPTHAFFLAREVGIGRVLVPPSPGTLCALGCIVADLRNDFVRTLYRSGGDVTDAVLEEAYGELEQRGRQWLQEETSRGIALESSFVVYSADMRYEGQAFEVGVPVTADERGNRAAIGRRFHEVYHSIFGASDPASPLTFVNLRASIVGVTPKVTRFQTRAGRAGARLGETRSVFVDGREAEAAVLPRAAVGRDGWLAGPLIIEQYDTTTFVPPGYRVQSDDAGNLVGEAV